MFFGETVAGDIEKRFIGTRGALLGRAQCSELVSNDFGAMTIHRIDCAQYCLNVTQRPSESCILPLNVRVFAERTNFDIYRSATFQLIQRWISTRPNFNDA